VSFADSRDGDCLIFNAWAANTPEVNRFLVVQARGDAIALHRLQSRMQSRVVAQI
jgi:hypothetical protein